MACETSTVQERRRSGIQMLLTCFPHLVLAVPQQLEDIHLQLARGGAVGVFVDAFFG